MVVKHKGKKRMGRPTKLTAEMHSEIVELIKVGNYIETACAVAGLHKSTFYDWMKIADASTHKNKYTNFSDAVKKAMAWAEARDVAIIARHSEKYWQASAWRLERKYPERWGRQKLEVQHSGKIDADVSHIVDSDREVIKRALAFVAQTAKQTVEYDEDSGDDFR